MNGLLDHYGSPTWAASYKYGHQRHRATWHAVRTALAAAAEGTGGPWTAAKPPAWLRPLVRERIRVLGNRWQQNGGFEDVRLLERLRLVAWEPDDAYVLALIGGLGDRRNTRSRAAQLRGDAGLLERLWRVFEVEGGGEISLANIDKFSAPPASWQATFLDLVADQTLARGDVLTACLQALQRDFSAYRAEWFSALYTHLDPTPEELGAHQGAHRNLLRSQVSATASLGARSLKRVSAAGALDDEDIDSLRPGLHARTKTAALDTLRVLADVAARRPSQRQAVAGVAADALEHPQADVQRAAVKLLTTLDAAASIKTETLPATVRRRLTETGATGPGTVPTPRPVATPPPLPSLPAAVTRGDVLERTAALLEDAGDPGEIELVLAALAVLEGPEGLRPLAKRARAVLQRGPREGVTPGWLRGQLARLVVTAAGDRPAPLPRPVAHPQTDFLLRRLAHVERSLARQVPPAALLATPSLAGGYLEPMALVERLAAEVGAARVDDLVAAILRLAPDGRPDALTRITGTEETQRVLRHALGAPVPQPSRFRRRTALGTPALWVAAARVRSPGADDQVLLDAGLDRSGQGRPVDATVSATPREFTWTDRRGEHRGQHWTFAVDIPHPATATDPAQPTVAEDSHTERQFGEDLEEWIPWIFAITPHDIEAPLSYLIHPVLRSMVGNEVEHDATRVLQAVAQHPGSLGTLGAVAIAAGLAADRTEHRVLAVDAILAFHQSGRLAAPDLAAAMRPLSSAAQLGRWSTALARVGQSLLGTFLADVLTEALSVIVSEQRGLHALVELLLEESVRLDRQVTDPVLNQWLSGLSGQGKAPRAAQQLRHLGVAPGT